MQGAKHQAARGADPDLEAFSCFFSKRASNLLNSSKAISSSWSRTCFIVSDASIKVAKLNCDGNTRLLYALDLRDVVH